MLCIVKQELIGDLLRRELKEGHVLKRNVCKLLIDVLKKPRREKNHVLKKIVFDSTIEDLGLHVCIKMLPNIRQRI